MLEGLVHWIRAPRFSPGLPGDRIQQNLVVCGLAGVGGVWAVSLGMSCSTGHHGTQNSATNLGMALWHFSFLLFN